MEPKRHDRIDAALVLEQDVEEGGPAAEVDLVDEVGLAFAQRRINEGSLHQLQRCEIELHEELRGKNRGQVGTSQVRPAEGAPGERVVGLSAHPRNLPANTDTNRTLASN